MLANAPDVRLRMRNPAPGPNGGGLYVSELQRTRLLDAAFAVVFEQGYRGMAVRSVAERAGVSSKTFYDLFTDREDCFLAAFDHGVEQLAGLARPAYEAESGWVEAIRAGLGALLELLDREPELCRLVFIEVLAVGPRVLERRAQLLGELASVIDQGRAGVKGAGEIPPLTTEAVLGTAFGVIHTRLSERSPEALGGLLNPLMATIVLPYRRARGGCTRAHTECSEAAIPRPCEHGPGDWPVWPGDWPVENTGGRGQGAAKAWRLTPHGEEVMQANRPLGERAA